MATPTFGPFELHRSLASSYIPNSHRHLPMLRLFFPAIVAGEFRLWSSFSDPDRSLQAEEDPRDLVARQEEIDPESIEYPHGILDAASAAALRTAAANWRGAPFPTPIRSSSPHPPPGSVT